jgi:CDP-diacylglycerol--glycerol-3-phosphate 3-phosphatidyltransferase
MIGSIIFPLEMIARVSIWFMVGLSLISAIDYFAAFWSKIDKRVQRRRRSFVLSRRRSKRSAVVS